MGGVVNVGNQVCGVDNAEPSSNPKVSLQPIMQPGYFIVGAIAG